MKFLSLLLLSLCACVWSCFSPWSVWEIVLVPYVVGVVVLDPIAGDGMCWNILHNGLPDHYDSSTACILCCLEPPSRLVFRQFLYFISKFTCIICQKNLFMFIGCYTITLSFCVWSVSLYLFMYV